LNSFSINLNYVSIVRVSRLTFLGEVGPGLGTKICQNLTPFSHGLALLYKGAVLCSQGLPIENEHNGEHHTRLKPSSSSCAQFRT